MYGRFVQGRSLTLSTLLNYVVVVWLDNACSVAIYPTDLLIHTPIRKLCTYVHINNQELINPPHMRWASFSDSFVGSPILQDFFVHPFDPWFSCSPSNFALTPASCVTHPLLFLSSSSSDLLGIHHWHANGSWQATFGPDPHNVTDVHHGRAGLCAG